MIKSSPLSEVVSPIGGSSKAAGSLAQKVISGGFWILNLNASYRVLRLISTLVLARLLAPSDFGVLGIAILTTSLLENLSLTGFDKALIQKKEDVIGFLNTTWTISVIRGVLLFLILFLFAPIVADFFEIPESEQVLKVLALSLIIDGLINIGIIFFSKEIDVKKLYIYRISGAIAYVIVAIPTAFVLRSVWALVYALLAEKIVSLILSYVLHSYRPRPEFNVEKAKELYSFGKWIFGIGVLSYLISQGDNAFVGKVLGATALGFYSMAYRISTLPAMEMYKMVSNIIFPAYSKLQEDVPKLRTAYFRTLQVIAFISFPIAGMIFVLSYEITKLFLGELWLPMVPLVQILSVYGLLNSMGIVAGAVFQAVGKPEIDTRLLFFRLVIMACLIYPLSFLWGTVGVAFAVLVSRIIDLIAVYMALRITQDKLSTVFKELLFPLASTVITILILSSFKAFLTSRYGIYGFFVEVVVGIILYLCISFVFAKALNYQSPVLLQKAFSEIISGVSMRKRLTF